MTSFWDLPRPVRDTIYRLHLVHEDQLDHALHLSLVKVDLRSPRRYEFRRRMPPICLLSARAEREAAPIYYGENHFVFGRLRDGAGSSVWRFNQTTWPRHIRLVRKVTYQWPRPHNGEDLYNGMGNAGECFSEIARFKALQELYIRVDEEAMIRGMLVSRRTLQRSPPRPLTLQDGIAIMRHPGMSSLLKICGVPHVEFLKWYNISGREIGGPMPGGFLESEILPKLQASRSKAMSKRPKGAFDFLSLPPEIRNRIYGLLLVFEGPIHPSTQSPSSVAKGRSRCPCPNSALLILAVNRQIHDEAYGIFYDVNKFEFYYPIQVQAFVYGIGMNRARQVRDLTVHYHDQKSGGVSLAEVGLQALKQLSGLRRLRLLCLSGELWIPLYTWSTYGVCPANPVKLPGLIRLFELRGISDVLVRDLEFEEDLEKYKKDKRFPDGFEPGSREAKWLKIEGILGRMNAALAAAQQGRHNKLMLENDNWHALDPLPPVAIEIKEAAEDEEIEEVINDDSLKDAAPEVEMSSPVPVSENIRDRLRSANRRIGTRDEDHNSEHNVQEAPGIETADDEDVEELLRNSDHGDDVEVPEDEIDDDIAVQHVARPGLSSFADQIGGCDGADDERKDFNDADEELNDSYADREPSVEL